MLKKTGLILAFAILLSAAASAQTNDVYWVNYFSNNTVIYSDDDDGGWIPQVQNDQFVYIVNPGLQGAPIDPNTGLFSGAGYLCANIYVFDKRQEMVECCSCPISPNGLLTLSVQIDLTGNPLIGVVPAGGVIKIVSSFPISVTGAGSSLTTVTALCDPGELGTVEVITPDLRAWGTHKQTLGPLLAPTGFATTEQEFLQAPLSVAEAAFLPITCRMSHYLGSGQGVCTCGNQVPI